MKNKIQLQNEQTILSMLQAREHEQSILLCIGNKIAAARHREDLLTIVNDSVLELFSGKYYTLCLINPDGKTHSPFLHSVGDQLNNTSGEAPVIHASHPINDGIFDVALASNDPVVFSLSQLLKDKNAPAYIVRWNKLGIAEMMVVKIFNGAEARGVLYVYAEKTGAFQESKFGLFHGLADQLGTGICNVMANEKIEQQLEEIRHYKGQLEEENRYLLEQNKLNNNFSDIIGQGPAMQQVYHLVAQVAASDSSVLLLGETGTGKELIARALHERSPRAKRLMIKINCAALPASLIESELFGHEKGSFTGATDRRVGKFELANGSTLFLDEIGELPLELQVKLLRVLQEKELERVGGHQTIKVDVRIIAATNRDLQKEVTEGRFRADLFYRLNVFLIILPPLRERKEDFDALTNHFIARFARNNGRRITGISKQALEGMMAYSWPGNVRELEHLIERSVLLNAGQIIKKVELANTALAAMPNGDQGFTIRPLEEVERTYILEVLKHCNGRISGPYGAAIKLHLPSTTLISKMKKLGTKKEHFVVTG